MIGIGRGRLEGKIELRGVCSQECVCLKGMGSNSVVPGVGREGGRD